MRFLVDHQLPLQLARYLAGLGHETVHVSEVGLDAATDETVWTWAAQHDRIVISKDEDSFFLANRVGDLGRPLGPVSATAASRP